MYYPVRGREPCVCRRSNTTFCLEMYYPVRGRELLYLRLLLGLVVVFRNVLPRKGAASNTAQAFLEVNYVLRICN